MIVRLFETYSVPPGFGYKRFLKIVIFFGYTPDCVGVIETYGLGFFLARFGAVLKEILCSMK